MFSIFINDIIYHIINQELSPIQPFALFFLMEVRAMTFLFYILLQYGSNVLPHLPLSHLLVVLQFNRNELSNYSWKYLIIFLAVHYFGNFSVWIELLFIFILISWVSISRGLEGRVLSFYLLPFQELFRVLQLRNGLFMQVYIFEDFRHNSDKVNLEFS